MLQRIQSLYLLLASLAIFALFLFPLVHNIYVGGVPSAVKVTGVVQDVKGQQAHVQSFIMLTAATAIAALLPILLIFRYKNRKQQIGLSYGYILLIFLFSFWQVQTVKSLADVAGLRFENFGIGILLCPLCIIFMLMAAKAIQRDEKLVKSAERLR